MASDGQAGDGSRRITGIHLSGVHGYMHHPPSDPTGALLLTHGAGSNCNAPLLVALAREFSRLGWIVLRCDLAFRQMRPTGPPRPAGALADREGLRLALHLLRSEFPGPLCLGGHSYGGRQASILASEDPTLARALLLLSYPLHPPNKPEQLRTAHWPELRTPVCFVHGTRDPFASVLELQESMRLIPARRDIVVVQGAAHDLKGGREIAFSQHFASFSNL